MAEPGKRMPTQRRKGDSIWGNYEESKAYAESQQREERFSRDKKTERLRALRCAREEAKN